MTDLDQVRTQEATARIRELNDQLRISHTGGTLVTTPGVLALGIYLNQAILIAIFLGQSLSGRFIEPIEPRRSQDISLCHLLRRPANDRNPGEPKRKSPDFCSRVCGRPEAPRRLCIFKPPKGATVSCCPACAPGAGWR